MYPLTSGVPGPINGTQCRDKRCGFYPTAVPSSKAEETGRSIMMIPESNGRDLSNSAKRHAHRISENRTFMRDRGVVDRNLSIDYKRWPKPHEGGTSTR
jgi:hypothetical protein